MPRSVAKHRAATSSALRTCSPPRDATADTPRHYSARAPHPAVPTPAKRSGAVTGSNPGTRIRDRLNDLLARRLHKRRCERVCGRVAHASCGRRASAFAGWPRTTAIAREASAGYPAGRTTACVLSERQHCAVRVLVVGGEPAVSRSASGVGCCSGSSAAVRWPLCPGHARGRWARAIDLLFVTASGLVIESVFGKERMTRLMRMGGR
jgi:hypothetical protein